MSYEPRGKVKTLLDAMRAAVTERPVWTSVDVAKVLETSTASVPAFVEPSIRHGTLFRKLENGRSQYSLTPFAPAATAAPVCQTAPMAQRETTATGWTPPQMVPPRSIQAAVPAGKHEARLEKIRADIAADMEPRGDRANRVLVDKLQELLPHWKPEPTVAPSPAPKPEAAPVEAPALTIEPDAPLDEQQEEPDRVTWNVWEDGDLDLFGLVELENGGHRLPAEAVRRLRNFIAWMPA